MKVVVAKDARDQANEIDAWWRENRPLATDLFTARDARKRPSHWRLADVHLYR